MKKLKEAFGKLHIPEDEAILEQYEKYMEGILLWNEKINLTAIKEREDFIIKHFVDSILCCNFPEYVNAESVIDIGTGAGFPGVPLAIIGQDKEFVLADSLHKRLKVIDDLTASIGLDNVTTVHGRAEELARNRDYREKFDLCVSRAVANMSVLTEYCLPFVRVGGFLLAYKGPDAEKEMGQAEKAIKQSVRNTEKTVKTTAKGTIKSAKIRRMEVVLCKKKNGYYVQYVEIKQG